MNEQETAAEYVRVVVYWHETDEHGDRVGIVAEVPPREASPGKVTPLGGMTWRMAWPREEPGQTVYLES